MGVVLDEVLRRPDCGQRIDKRPEEVNWLIELRVVCAYICMEIFGEFLERFSGGWDDLAMTATNDDAFFRVVETIDKLQGA